MRFLVFTFVIFTHSAFASLLTKPIGFLISRNVDGIGTAVTECRTLLSQTHPPEVSVARVEGGINIQIEVVGRDRIERLLAPYQSISNRRHEHPLRHVPSLAEILGSHFLGLDWTWNSPLQKFNDEIWQYYKASVFPPGLQVTWNGATTRSVRGSVSFTRRLGRQLLPGQKVEATLNTAAQMIVHFELEKTQPSLLVQFAIEAPKQICEVIAQSVSRISNGGTL